MSLPDAPQHAQPDGQPDRQPDRQPGREPDGPPRPVGRRLLPAAAPHDRLQLRAAAVALVLGGVALLATALLARLAGVPHSFLTREPQVALDGPYFAGALSSVGALAWAVGAVSALLAAAVLRGRPRRVLAAGGAVTTAMLLDDLFLLHDHVYPRLGVPETLVQGGYLVAVVLVAWWGRDLLGRAGLLACAVAVALWGASALVDLALNEHPVNLDQLTEDGAKLLGVALWSATWATLAHRLLRAREATGRP